MLFSRDGRRIGELQARGHPSAAGPGAAGRVLCTFVYYAWRYHACMAWSAGAAAREILGRAAQSPVVGSGVFATARGEAGGYGGDREAGTSEKA